MKRDGATTAGFRYGRMRSTWRTRGVVAGAIAMLLALEGCGHGVTTIHGSLWSRGNCLSLVYLAGGSPVDHIEVTFRDSSGNVIGTAKTGIGIYDPPKPWHVNETCTVYAPYELDIPKEDFYQAEVEGFDRKPSPVSYDNLAADDFKYDLQISSG